MSEKIKNGLVMEGGAMRGIFTAGVIDVLMENDITFDGAIGVSAGAAFGCNYKSHQIGRAIRYNMKYSRDPRYCSWRSLIKTGDMFGAEFCFHELPKNLDKMDFDTFNSSEMEFYVVCTDVMTGKAIYHKTEKADDNEMEWLRASASMPVFSHIVEIDGKKMLDDGISDSIPLKYMQDIGYKKNVVILTQPADYVKGGYKMIPLIHLVLRKYPNIVQAIKNRHLIYNEEVKYVRQEEKKGNALVIRPEKALPIGHVEHDPLKLKEIYDIGRETAEKKLDDIIKFLNI